ncbi:MAG TPA: class I lanthipeptide [Kofleriaceae bacterium]|nr:class I lanthipeptide [Kofleriaceae bacterium]
MKRTSNKDKPELLLKRRLQLVRTTIRELTPAQLEQVNGGNGEGPITCSLYTYNNA